MKTNYLQYRLADQLRNYQTLTVGDVIRLSYGDSYHLFNVVKVRQDSSHMEEHEATTSEGKFACFRMKT